MLHTGYANEIACYHCRKSCNDVFCTSISNNQSEMGERKLAVKQDAMVRWKVHLLDISGNWQKIT